MNYAGNEGDLICGGFEFENERVDDGIGAEFDFASIGDGIGGGETLDHGVDGLIGADFGGGDEFGDGVGKRRRWGGAFSIGPSLEKARDGIGADMNEPAVIVGKVDGEGTALGNRESGGLLSEPRFEFFSRGDEWGRGIDACDNFGAGEALEIDEFKIEVLGAIPFCGKEM